MLYVHAPCRAKEGTKTTTADDREGADASEGQGGEELIIQRVKQEKAARKADAEYETEVRSDAFLPSSLSLPECFMC